MSLKIVKGKTVSENIPMKEEFNHKHKLNFAASN